MKRISIWILLGGMALGLAAGCGLATSETFGGETHWLQSCGSPGSGAAECGSKLDCVCGVCTSACSDETSCSGLSDDARCAMRTATPYASSCEGSAPEQLCVRSADVNAPEDNPLPSPDAGTPREPDMVPAPPSCVETAQGCLACDEARQSLTDEAHELVQTAGYDACSSDDECGVLVGWASVCESQCEIPINNRSYEMVSPALEALGADYCRDQNQWRAVCGDPIASCSTMGDSLVCRAGRCVTTDMPCADRTLAACELDAQCELARAFPYDPAQQCFTYTLVSVGCISSSLGCPPVVTPAVDANRNCFLFGGCLPAGLVQEPEHPCSSATASMCSN